MKLEFKYLKDRIDEITAEANCNHCFGRGVSGYNSKTGSKIVCQCVLKKIDKIRREYYEQNKSQKDSLSTRGKG